jgi:hypothetical protein
MALDTTPGAATANSYASLAEFKTYRTNRLPAVAQVLLATDPAIEVGLIMGARSLDANLDWTGSAVDAVQALTWPRTSMLSRNKFPIPSSGVTSIPQPLKDAQCEIAYQLLAGVDLVSDNVAAQLGVSLVQAGDVRVAFQRDSLTTFEAADIFLRRLGSEFNYLSVAIPAEARRLLVESWFNQPSIFRPVLFRAL